MASEDSNADTAPPAEPTSKPAEEAAPAAPAAHGQPTPTELLSSAKLVADAATSTFSNQADKVDKGAVAGAAADLLGAASRYGNLQEGKFGTYVAQAENYLEKYAESGGRPPATEAAEEKPAADASADSGAGGFLKMAQGFLK